MLLPVVSTLLIWLANNHIHGITGFYTRARSCSLSLSLSCLHSYYCLSGLWCSTHTLMKKTTPITVFIRLRGLFSFFILDRDQSCVRGHSLRCDCDICATSKQPSRNLSEKHLKGNEFTAEQFHILDLCTSIRLNIRIVKRCFVAYLLIYDSDQNIEECKREL